MPSPQRLEFITRHFGDLQTIRFAPVPTAMVLSLAAHKIPPLRPNVLWEVLVFFLLLAGGFYWWSTAVIRRRYGSVKLSREETRRMQHHPIIIALYVIAILGYFFAHAYFGDSYIASVVLFFMLTNIVDSTNLASRRHAWAIGMVVLFTGVPFLRGVAGGAAVFSLAGTVWLSLSVFDFLLLRRTFAEISRGAVVHFG